MQTGALDGHAEHRTPSGFTHGTRAAAFVARAEPGAIRQIDREAVQAGPRAAIIATRGTALPAIAADTEFVPRVARSHARIAARAWDAATRVAVRRHATSVE